MFASTDLDWTSPEKAYAELVLQAEGLLHGERDFIANTANIAALLFNSMPDLNWAGFYILRNGELVLGPFQGKPACVRIPIGKGVCGTAAKQGKTIFVQDVDEFPGHIACDAASRSEIVVPLLRSPERLVCVLDLDSPLKGRFGRVDQEYLERIAAAVLGGFDD